MLNMQSADYAKGLLKFKYGKRMGDNDSYGYFAIAGANLFGEVDKGTIQDRVQWIDQLQGRRHHQAFQRIQLHHYSEFRRRFACGCRIRRWPISEDIEHNSGRSYGWPESRRGRGLDAQQRDRIHRAGRACLPQARSVCWRDKRSKQRARGEQVLY